MLIILKRENPYYFLLIMPLITPIFACVIFSFIFQFAYGQLEIDNWQTYVDPNKRFTLFYPLGWRGKENYLSSIDLTLTNPNATKPFQITIIYIMNDSSLNYSGNEIIVLSYYLTKTTSKHSTSHFLLSWQ